MNRIELKTQAKSVLGSKLFGNAWLIVVLVVFLATLITNFIPAIGMLLLTGPVTVGLCSFFLKRIRTGKDFDIDNTLDGVRGDVGGNILLGLMVSVFTFLWSMLFVIPGIIKAYSYSMASFIRVDHPEYNWKQCIEASKQMTNGHKMDLFILDLSFIGWYIVGAFCFGIGSLWAQAYHETTLALAYEKLKAAN